MAVLVEESYYQVVTGSRKEHTSVSTHTAKFMAEAEAKQWNEAYQTDEYWVLTKRIS